MPRRNKVPERSPGIDAMISKTPGRRGAALAKLRKIVHEADPGITEEVKWRRPSNPLGAAVWEHDGIVCIGIVLKERVRLSFAAGASLPDPHKLFNAQLEGKSRAIDVHEGDKIDETALKALVRSAVRRNLDKVRKAKTARG
ncbi:MAG: DUF1801 domain-containing protein [Chloroflexota bacterium]|nr:DUF1801 domain-containing protein [Chloroflexota bacterium]MDE3192101.1 DUF1801 domain-containing protein [Chloroflexota bacterium]